MADRLGSAHMTDPAVHEAPMSCGNAERRQEEAAAAEAASIGARSE
jgi:hypothetical protein